MPVRVSNRHLLSRLGAEPSVVFSGVSACTLRPSAFGKGPFSPREDCVMAPGCVYDCAHPLWGSDGTCSINNDGEATCACSPGYASKDVLGNSSCVPTIVLWGFFLLGAVIGATMTLFLMWHIVKFFDIRGSARHTRKAILRLQILTASRFEKSVPLESPYL